MRINLVAFALVAFAVALSAEKLSVRAVSDPELASMTGGACTASSCDINTHWMQRKTLWVTLTTYDSPQAKVDVWDLDTGSGTPVKDGKVVTNSINPMASGCLFETECSKVDYNSSFTQKAGGSDCWAEDVEIDRYVCQSGC